MCHKLRVSSQQRVITFDLNVKYDDPYVLNKPPVFCISSFWSTFMPWCPTAHAWRIRAWNQNQHTPLKTLSHLSKPPSTTQQDKIFQYALKSLSETFLARNIVSVLNYELNKTKSSKHAAFTQRTLDCSRAWIFWDPPNTSLFFMVWLYTEKPLTKVT